MLLTLPICCLWVNGADMRTLICLAIVIKLLEIGLIITPIGSEWFMCIKGGTWFERSNPARYFRRQPGFLVMDLLLTWLIACRASRSCTPLARA